MRLILPPTRVEPRRAARSSRPLRSASRRPAGGARLTHQSASGIYRAPCQLFGETPNRATGTVAVPFPNYFLNPPGLGNALTMAPPPSSFAQRCRGRERIAFPNDFDDGLRRPPARPWFAQGFDHDGELFFDLPSACLVVQQIERFPGDVFGRG